MMSNTVASLPAKSAALSRLVDSPAGVSKMLWYSATRHAMIHAVLETSLFVIWVWCEWCKTFFQSWHGTGASLPTVDKIQPASPVNFWKRSAFLKFLSGGGFHCQEDETRVAKDHERGMDPRHWRTWFWPGLEPDGCAMTPKSAFLISDIHMNLHRAFSGSAYSTF